MRKKLIIVGGSREKYGMVSSKAKGSRRKEENTKGIDKFWKKRGIIKERKSRG